MKFPSIKKSLTIFALFVFGFLYSNQGVMAQSIPFYQNPNYTSGSPLLSTFGTSIYQADVYVPFVPTCNSNYCKFSEINFTTSQNTTATSSYNITASVVSATTSTTTLICLPTTVNVGTTTGLTTITTGSIRPTIYFDNCFLNASTTYWIKFQTDKIYSGFSIGIGGSSVRPYLNTGKIGIWVWNKGSYPTYGWEEQPYYFTGNLSFDTISTTTVINNLSTEYSTSTISNSTTTINNNSELMSTSTAFSIDSMKNILLLLMCGGAVFFYAKFVMRKF